MRVLGPIGLVGIWQAVSSLLASTLLVTALFTLAAALLGAWAIAVLRGQ